MDVRLGGAVAWKRSIRLFVVVFWLSAVDVSGVVPDTNKRTLAENRLLWADERENSILTFEAAMENLKLNSLLL